jgi:CheY-like chemotaxis protein
VRLVRSADDLSRVLITKRHGDCGLRIEIWARETVTNVLLVDDDCDNLWALQIALESVGHRVSIASSAHSAMSVMRRESIQLVITDFEMPGIDGAELAFMIASQPLYRGIPVLLLLVAPEPVCRGRSWVRYVRKPASFADLIAAIDNFAAARLPLHTRRACASASPLAVMKCQGSSAGHWSGINSACWRGDDV